MEDIVQSLLTMTLIGEKTENNSSVKGSTLFCPLFDTHKVIIYTVGHTKRDTFIFLITLANIDRFS